MIHFIASVVEPPTQYGPIILWAMGVASPFIIAFGAWVTVSLSRINSGIAVLNSKEQTNTPSLTKVVNEVIDLKLASAELNETTKTHSNQLKWLVDRANYEITADHDTVNRMRNKNDNN